MATLIAVILIITVWKLKDKQVSLWLSGFQEKDIQRFQIITSSINSQLLHKARYTLIKQARYIFIPIALLKNELLAYVLACVGLFVVYKIPFWRVKYAVNKRIRQIRYQFPIYLRQLQVLLQNNTVTKAIEASLDQVPDLFKDDIELLHKRLLDNPMDLNNYINCMSQYDLPEVQRAMKWLYRYQSIGLSDVNRQFNRMITSTSKWLRQSRLASKDQSLALYQWWGILPLFGVTVVFLSAMLSVATSFFERR